ncbi:acetyltransferase [Dorea sp. D27]|uniref:acetyltransferase n=1 Tax=Dorea sp. D27 TaxID=658665 RepID=UPI00067353CC|nr:acetyltransferase [Dorea sp. D27]KMZ53791.1 hexapeptide transferase family protein [Dorea sp. D27]
MKTLLIWGAGDQGTVTMDCALAMNVYSRIDFLEIKGKGCREIPGYRIYQEEEIDLDDFLNSYDEVIVATGDNQIREDRITLLMAMGISVATITHPTAVISPTAKIGRGCTLFANAVIHTNAAVGMGCIINTAAIIEHDCIIEDFVNVSPKAAMAGHTKIGKSTFLGIGCTIIDDVVVGKDVVIGAGAVVIQDIPDCVVAVGVPAKAQ